MNITEDVALNAWCYTYELDSRLVHLSYFSSSTDCKWFFMVPWVSWFALWDSSSLSLSFPSSPKGQGETETNILNDEWKKTLFLCAMVQNNQESRCKYRVTRSSVHFFSFARITHSFPCYAVLAMHYASALIWLFVCSWEIESLNTGTSGCSRP